MPPEPSIEGWLDVGDRQQIWWGRYGTPTGTPAVVLHGGPGSGCPDQWAWFDLERIAVVLVDQRQCGRSRPHASEPVTDLSANTTAHLVADLERLRTHLGIERWLVTGISWGTTLALAYAQAHPTAVTGMVLASVGTTSHAEVDWLTRAMGRVFPQQWQVFRDALPPGDRDGNLAAAYHRLLIDPDPAVHTPAAAAWCAWEDTRVAPTPGHQPHPRYADPTFRLAFARIVTWYFAHAAFLPDGQILDQMGRLADIPAVLIHGRLDLSTPLDATWQIHRRWPASRLVILDGAGHGATQAAIREAVATLTTACSRPTQGPVS